MVNKRFNAIVKKNVKENSSLFNSLKDFENTGKIKTKERLNFTIDKRVASDFRRKSKEEGYNMSGKVELLIRKFVNGK